MLFNVLVSWLCRDINVPPYSPKIWHPNWPEKIGYFVAIIIGISKMDNGDKYLDYPDKILERMVKL